MGTILLIGNGLNICVAKSVATKNLLANHTIFSRKEIDRLLGQGKGFSSIFEASFGKDVDQDSVVKIFQKIKNDIKLLNEKRNGIYDAVRENLGRIDGIITTNYDFAIEHNVFGCGRAKTEAIRRNCGYRFKSENKTIWHIHGDLNHIQNLCLGYFGYQKYLKASHSNLSYRITKRNDLFARLEKQMPESLYRFLVDDVYMLGLGLTENELIIWSVLTLRRELIRRGLYSFCGVKENKIIVYDVRCRDSGEDVSSAEKESLEKYYDSYSITYRLKHISKEEEYRPFYQESLKEIFSELGRGPERD